MSMIDIYYSLTIQKEQGSYYYLTDPKFSPLFMTAGCLPSLIIEFGAFSSPNVAKVVQRGNCMV